VLLPLGDLATTSTLRGASAVADESEPVDASLLPDQRVGALTQIFEEYRPEVTPEIVEGVVHEIDAVAPGAVLEHRPPEEESLPADSDEGAQRFQLVSTGTVMRLPVGIAGRPPTSEIGGLA
jgi:hypothetical protein